MKLANALQILGLDKLPSDMENLKKAYRIMAKRYHPDRFSHDPPSRALAEKRMTEINLAFSTLHDFVSTIEIDRFKKKGPDSHRRGYANSKDSGKSGSENSGSSAPDGSEGQSSGIRFESAFISFLRWFKALVVSEESLSTEERSASNKRRRSSGDSVEDSANDHSKEDSKEDSKDPAGDTANRAEDPAEPEKAGVNHGNSASGEGAESSSGIFSKAAHKKSNSSVGKDRAGKEDLSSFEEVLRKSRVSLESEKTGTTGYPSGFSSGDSSTAYTGAEGDSMQERGKSGADKKVKAVSSTGFSGRSSFRFVKRRQKFMDSDNGPVEKISRISRVSKI